MRVLNSFSTKRWMLVAVAVASMFGLSAAKAVPTLTVYDDVGNFVVITDGGVGDACGAVGCVTFIGVIGDFVINVDTGLTKPVIGSAAVPELDLSYNTSYTGTGGVGFPGSLLTIVWSDTDFLPISGTFDGAIGGTNNNTTTFFDAYVNAANVVCSLTFPCPGVEKYTPFSSSGVSFAFAATSGLFTFVANWSMSEVVRIQAGVVGTSSTRQASGDASQHITGAPEPGTLLLLGGALAGLGFMRRRKAAK
jgi:hypothetical protein